MVECGMQPSEFEKLTLAKFFALLSSDKKELAPVSYAQVVKLMRKEQKLRFGREVK